jgi:hypothetical protein
MMGRSLGMPTSDAFRVSPHAAVASATPDDTRIYWLLRIGAALCFIGHGAFGILTKEAWVPYFAFAGIPRDAAFTLMPLVGMVDITAGMAVLFAPRRFLLVYMAIWSLWTALLRPLTGESFFETLERAGNYGVPLALLIMLGIPRAASGWFEMRGPVAADATRRAAAVKILQATTALLLFGHGALAAITGKEVFATHYAAVGLSASVVPLVGWLEMTLAIIVAWRPFPLLLWLIVAWKLATEALFPLAGAPMWEFVERAGSYVAPAALAVLIARRRVVPEVFARAAG